MKGILAELQGGETLEMISSTYPRTVQVSSKYFVLPSWQYWHYMHQSIFQVMEKIINNKKITSSGTRSGNLLRVKPSLYPPSC